MSCAALDRLHEEIRFSKARGRQVACIRISSMYCFEGTIVSLPCFPADMVLIIRAHVKSNSPDDYIAVSKYSVIYLHPGDWLDILCDGEAWATDALIEGEANSSPTGRPRTIFDIPCDHTDMV